MTNYMANLDGMHDVIAQLRQLYNAEVNSLQALDQAKNNYAANNQGSAIDGYEAAQNEWNAALNEFNTALTVAERALGEIGDGYNMTDQRGANRFA
ncbi:WXG100 family type VII secretion target [Micromonospora sp. NPDC047548]|uniref:WXG100 family type VII secretion target n=1 Tax=Micromonospora sp. NPDC047548 TaxID=3155624 RepID=UPI0033FA0B4B